MIRRSLRAAVALAATAASAYALACLYMFVVQRDLQYAPSSVRIPPPDGAIEIVLNADDGTKPLAWFGEGFAPDAVSILFLHGNGGARQASAERMEFFLKRGYRMIVPHYRGFGGSKGTPSEDGIITDALAAYDALIERGANPERIVALGESLGGGVAVAVADKKDVAALVLEGTFASAADVAQRRYPWLPVRLLMLDTFDSEALIGDIAVPILVIHGDADQVIPLASAERLVAAAPHENTTFVVVKGANHGTLFVPKTWAKVDSFLLDRLATR